MMKSVEIIVLHTIELASKNNSKNCLSVPSNLVELKREHFMHAVSKSNSRCLNYQEAGSPVGASGTERRLR
jgi:hypothetical protein